MEDGNSSGKIAILHSDMVLSNIVTGKNTKIMELIEQIKNLKMFSVGEHETINEDLVINIKIVNIGDKLEL